MMMKGLQKMTRLCQKVGLKTWGEMLDFYKKEKQDGEDFITTLERYAAELGDYDASKNQNN